MVLLLKLWCNYLYGLNCQVFTDHLSLLYIFIQIYVNFGKPSWLEILKDYDVNILYHLRKANMFTRVLNRKTLAWGFLS